MEKIENGSPNWEEILGGEFFETVADHNFENVQKQILWREYENTFMIVPCRRLCEHCLNPTCFRVLPLGRDLQARGRRHSS